MAAIKVKIATGIMILQYQRSRFSKNCISANCPLCNIEPEDVTHFILKCEKLSSIRNRFIQELKPFLVDCNKPSLLIQELFNDEENLLHLIIDCTTYHFLTFKEQVRIETLTRELITARTPYADVDFSAKTEPLISSDENDESSACSEDNGDDFVS
ncbi:unnamed protein product [Mytilus coruscus]|uniref:Reverse transcriptase zinc-binding domain-containing protein n=1 Tax=Mytilus coruscus TaxID=42192 RepID=A0A6J8C6S5_MYTCO|nr:unnamed protein product [Mytilus coruscus]